MIAKLTLKGIDGLPNSLCPDIVRIVFNQQAEGFYKKGK